MSVKLYKHNESGEIVAAILNKKSQEFRVFHNNGYVYTSEEEWFIKKYTPLPEAPEVGSDEWAYQQVKSGRQVCIPLLSGRKRIAVDIYEFCELITEYSEYSHQDFKSWEILPPLKPIVECLPHEFVQGQEVLVRDSTTGTWGRRTFHQLYFEGAPSYGTSMPTHRKCLDDEKGIFKFRYCLPYAENAHLEGQTTDGEHGAVPKGYVPPHVPKLGDDDYWQVGDKVVDFATGGFKTIEKIKQGMIWFDKDQKRADFYTNGKKSDAVTPYFMRTLYHAESYVNDDGTVHEHIPTRPHRIEE